MNELFDFRQVLIEKYGLRKAEANKIIQDIMASSQEI